MPATPTHAAAPTTVAGSRGVSSGTAARAERTPAAGSVAADRPVARVSIVLPVKPLAIAKSRLAPAVGDGRSDLALAFAADTVEAALSCAEVGIVIVVTSDEHAADRLAGAGAVIVPDVPDAGLNPALARGAQRARALAPGASVVAMSADLPALRPAELARALVAAAPMRRAFVADRAGAGTTWLFAADGVELDPRFGPGSRAAHRASGAHELSLADIDTLRQDVDTGADLAAAVAMGVGRHTAAALRRWPDTAAPRPR